MMVMRKSNTKADLQECTELKSMRVEAYFRYETRHCELRVLKEMENVKCVLA